jgi:hypothetical protein
MFDVFGIIWPAFLALPSGWLAWILPGGTVLAGWCRYQVLFGEFDPGSGRTLAACLTHASRTDHCFRVVVSGERVSNTWVTCPELWDNSGKPGLIPDISAPRMGGA